MFIGGGLVVKKEGPPLGGLVERYASVLTRSVRVSSESRMWGENG